MVQYFWWGSQNTLVLSSVYVYEGEESGEFFHAILLMIHEYQAQGIFDVISIGADKAFDPVESKLKDEPYNITLTTCDANCHAECVERMIQFVKEQI